MNSHGQVANFQKLKKHLKQSIQFSGKGLKYLDGIIGQTNRYFSLINVS